MQRLPSRSSYAAVLAVSICAVPAVAFAYVGPGAGLSAIGTVVAFFGAILLAVVGFVWYPIKRLRNKYRENRDAAKPR